MKPFMVMMITGLWVGSAAADIGCVAGVGCAAESQRAPEASGAATNPLPDPATVAASNAVSGADGVVGEWRGADVFVYRNGEWTLEITYLNRGTRSEGQDGRLFKGESLVKGDQKGQTLETAMGLLRFYGSERRQKWDNTGWNFADRRNIKRSEALPAPPAADSPATP